MYNFTTIHSSYCWYWSMVLLVCGYQLRPKGFLTLKLFMRQDCQSVTSVAFESLSISATNTDSKETIESKPAKSITETEVRLIFINIHTFFYMCWVFNFFISTHSRLAAGRTELSFFHTTRAVWRVGCVTGQYTGGDSLQDFHWSAVCPQCAVTRVSASQVKMCCC